MLTPRYVMLCACVLAGPAAAQPVVISEIMANPSDVSDSDGEWFEVYNPCDDPVDLRGMTIRDSTGSPHTIAAPSPVLVPGNGYALLGNNDDPFANGGLVLDYEYGPIALNNSGDSIILERDGMLVDAVAYSSADVQAGSSLQLDQGYTPAENDNLSNWSFSTIIYNFSDRGTPGSPNDMFGPSGTVNCGPGGPAAGPPVVISEIMANPSDVSDSDGEWFEVYNPCDEPVDLRGMTIRDNTGSPHTIAGPSPVLVPGNGYALLGNNDDPFANGGLVLDYTYGPVALNNGGDSIILERDGRLVDAVVYGGNDVQAGSSLQLDQGYTPAENDDMSNWSFATLLYNSTDRGTPGVPNDMFGPSGTVDCRPACPVDTNGDGQVSPADFNAWILAFNMQSPSCDQNGDGLCTPADFNAWILNFNSGC